MYDVPPAIYAPFESATLPKFAAWEDPHFGRSSGLDLPPTWLDGNESRATTPAGISDDRALMFIVDGQPMVVRLKVSSGENETTQYPEVLSTAERLDMVKSLLKISVTQLSDLFGVTRKSVYDWYEGKGPRAPMSGRIDSLIDALAGVPDANLRKLAAMWNIALPGGSFRSTLQSATLTGYDLTAALVAKLNELSVEMSAAARPSRRSAVYVGESNIADIDLRSDAI